MNQKSMSNRKNSMMKSATTLICIMVLVSLSIQESFAQGVTPTKGQQSIKKEAVLSNDVNKNNVNNVTVVAPVEEQSPITTLPYYNYKGLTDINTARLAWAKDYPEAFAKLNGQTIQKPTNSQVQNKPTTVITKEEKLPNADRILPVIYDDSQTRNEGKKIK